MSEFKDLWNPNAPAEASPTPAKKAPKNKALFSCRDCGAQISRRSMMCPHCGRYYSETIVNCVLIVGLKLAVCVILIWFLLKILT